MFRVNKLQMRYMKCVLTSNEFKCFTAQVAGIKSRPQPQKNAKPKTVEKTSASFARKVFSGIQPTGHMHIGNFLGTVNKWVQLQNNSEDVTICIVDMHSITMPQNPPVLRENIFKMAAALLACGIDPTQSTLFVQSAVMEHCEFNWILGCMTTMARLAHLPQYKEKARSSRNIPLGLYVYPVLQASDILLYKATHVPVGEDQLQHVQLAQHLAKNFNNRYGEMFPICTAMLGTDESVRIRSLRDPVRKMSKSEENSKGTIFICDEPDVITEKIKKAVTDFTSDITYDPISRPGVSNLVAMHSLITGLPIKQVIEESKMIDTATYKMRVSEAIIEHFKPIREQYNQHLMRRNELVYLLEIGAEKARQTAQQTMNDVKQRLGLGTYLNMPVPVEREIKLSDPVENKLTASQKLTKGIYGVGYKQEVIVDKKPGTDEKHEEPNNAWKYQKPMKSYPIVPIQKRRIEKEVKTVSRPPFLKMDSLQTLSFSHQSKINSIYDDIMPGKNNINQFKPIPVQKPVSSMSYGNSDKSSQGELSLNVSGSNMSKPMSSGGMQSLNVNILKKPMETIVDDNVDLNLETDAISEKKEN